MEQMKNEFEMSMVGELTFFLGLQVKQMEEGTFVSQSEYARIWSKSLALRAQKLPKHQ